MFEHFTRGARAVVKHAQAEAQELGSPTIEAEHLLLALTLTAPDGAAASALAEAGLDHDTLVDALDAERERSLLAVGISVSDFDVPSTRLAHRPRMAASAKVALEQSLRAALGRNDRRIEAGHILLGLLHAEAGTVPRALAQAGVDREHLRHLTGLALTRSQLP